MLIIEGFLNEHYLVAGWVMRHAAEDHDFGVGAMGAYFTQCLEAAHARHVQVEQHEIEWVGGGGKFLDGFLPIACFLDFISLKAEHEANGFAHHFLVVGQKNPLLRN